MSENFKMIYHRWQKHIFQRIFQGGVRAIIYTNAFQALIMILGVLIIAVVASVQGGGIPEVWKVNQEHGRVQFWK